MGHKVKDIKNVQKERLRKAIIGLLSFNIDLMNFDKTLTQEKENIKAMNKSIRLTNKAIEIIKQVEHVEILQSLYNSFINGKESYFVLFASTIAHKNTINHWDKTEKGFKEFLELEKTAIEKSKNEFEKRKEMQDALAKAKEQGKKVEMVYENGKLKPTIVDDKPN